jgi:hypothetical protein
MRKILLIIALFAMLYSCADASKKKEDQTNSNAEKVEKQSEKPILTLADFDAKAGAWVGKEVQVKGIVDHVCKHGGKKITLVDDNGEVHVKSEERFDDAIVGSEILVTGIVSEFIVDESFCLQKEEDYSKALKDGEDDEKTFKQKMEQIQYYRDSIKATGKDHISYYSLDYVSHIEDK